MPKQDFEHPYYNEVYIHSTRNSRNENKRDSKTATFCTAHQLQRRRTNLELQIESFWEQEVIKYTVTTCFL